MAKLYYRELSILLALLLAVHGVSGVVHAEGHMTAATNIRYDVDSDTENFCTMVGSGNAFGSPISGAGRIETSGSSATVTSETASSGALAPVVAGDVIMVRPSTPSKAEPFNAGYAAVVTAKASADSITVDPAVDWSAGYSYTFLHRVCGTTIDDGWVDVSNATKFTMTIAYLQGDLDALLWRFQCKTSAVGAVPVTVYPSEGDGCGIAGTLSTTYCSFATDSDDAVFTWEDFGPWSSCRIGVMYATTDASDATTDLERVSGSITVAKGGN